MHSNENNGSQINDEENNFNNKISSIITQESFDKQDKIEFSGLTKIEGDDNLRTRRIYNDEDLKIINEDDDPLNWGRINYILMLELIVIVDQLLEGSNKVPSFIGIKRCSFFIGYVF